jgi:metal-responsive CopG/Arc/MetJ family transcriptional regulator
MTYIESISFPDISLKMRLDKYLKETNMKRSPVVNKAVDEYLINKGA